MTDQGLYEFLCVAVVLLASCWLLAFLVRRLTRSRPDFAIAKPILFAFAVRLLAAIGLGQLAIARDLRGGDELTFLARAEHASGLPFSASFSLDQLTSELHTFLFQLHYRIFDLAPPEMMLRVEMVFFATVGIALLAAAVYELAGPQARR